MFLLVVLLVTMREWEECVWWSRGIFDCAFVTAVK